VHAIGVVGRAAAADNMFTLKEKDSGTKRDISYADVTKLKGMFHSVSEGLQESSTNRAQ
jgi:hypothetical protein